MTTTTAPAFRIGELPLRLLERDVLPDALIRLGIRQILAARLADEETGDAERNQERKRDFIQRLRRSRLAIHTEDANAQHYELPSEFFEAVLGPYLKYSSCYFLDTETNFGAALGDAEARMLALTVARAGIVDGDRILELGCGWGSLSLFMAERFPRSTIVAVSNSRTQKVFIDGRARARGLSNLEVRTADVNVLEFDEGTRFDRVVSVEMFEHLRNWEHAFERVAKWLAPSGTFFLHVFTHARFAYPYEDKGPSDWMARHFFTGGMMPSHDLALHFQRDLALDQHWVVNGRHYQRTAEAWLERMDAQHVRLAPLFERTYGEDAKTLWVRWRVFFMACAELWGYSGGNEWFVSHYRFVRR
jgi:cyclopropane-fatty-acyl-phospholipid synthase